MSEKTTEKSPTVKAVPTFKAGQSVVHKPTGATHKVLSVRGSGASALLKCDGCVGLIRATDCETAD